MNDFIIYILWTFFGLQHSLLARPYFKSQIKYLLGERFEKNIYPFLYFLSQCIIFLIVYDLIRNVKPDIIFFQLPNKYHGFIFLLNRISNLYLLLTVFHFNIGEFTGFSQLVNIFTSNRKNSINTNQPLNSSFLYRYIRHPMYLGIILVYLTSTTIYSDVFFVNVVSILIYIDIGSYFEEKTLIRKFGSSYIDFQSKTNKFIPFIR